MEFFNCTLDVKFKKSFKISDKQFEKFFNEAYVAKPNYLAFDIDFDYEGIVGATGIQVCEDSVADGKYSINKISESEYEIDASCTVNAEFMFMNEAGFKAFNKARENKSIKTSVSSVCNNGKDKKTFWSMECDPYIELNSDELKINQS